MSNVVKLKRGSGSDPVASDLVVGELAIRTDLGKIFTKKDNGSVAEISGGGGVSDGDKGDITVSNSGDTWTIDSGVIDNANIASNASISLSKLEVITSNRIVGNDSGNAVPKELTAAEVRTIINVENGATADQSASEIVALIADQTIAPSAIDMEDSEEIRLGNSDDLKIYHSGSHSFIQDVGTGSLKLAGADVQVVNADNTAVMAQFISGGKSELRHDGNTKFETSSSGVSVTGNIAVSGTVDGVDIAARDTLFGGLTSSSGVLSNGVTATTQSAGNNTTRVATTAFVSTAISNLIDSSPSTLNTLNELAAALGDDANFSTTVTNSIATKLPLAGGQITGNITCSGSQTFDGRDLSVDGSKLDGIESGATADQSASEILTLIKTVDGAGSGLDADTVDGIASGSFLRGDVDDTTVGHLTFNRSSDAKFSLQGSNNPYFNLREGTTNKARFQWSESGYIWIQNFEDDSVLVIRDNLGFSPDAGSTIHSIFHAGNLSVGDGGLTQKNFTTTLKNKLDGIAAGATNVTNNNQLTNGAGYVTANTQLSNEQVQDIVGAMVSGNTESGITVNYQDSDGTLDFIVASQTDNNFTNADHSKLDGIESGATADQTASEILNLLKTVDGAGSGLDADLLDGMQASDQASNATIVARNSSGYIFANYFNTTANDTGTGSDCKFYASEDNYIRYIDLRSMRAAMNVSARSSTFSSREDQTGDQNYWIGSQGWGSSNFDSTVWDFGSCFFDTWSNPSGQPSGTSHWTGMQAMHYTNGSARYGYRITCGAGDPSLFYIQGRWGGSPTSWHKIWNAANDGSGSGLDADKLDGVEGSSYLRSDANDTFTSILTLSTTSRDGLNFSGNATDDNRGLAFNGRIAISADYNDGYLRLNNASEFGNGTYTPSRIRADGGYRVGGTEVINSSAQLIASRLTGALPAIDGSALTGLSAGASGGGSDEVFWCNGQNVTSSYTIPNGKNAMSAGPITINSGVTVTIGSGETWTVV